MIPGSLRGRAAGARVLAQAKINLALRILAREDGGWHQLETLFCRLALGDVVTVRATAGARSLACDGPEMPASGLGAPEANLAWHAADAYARHAGWPAGFAIVIEKRIPVGSGLGGGSADAGAVLRALDALSPSPIGEDRLLALARTLGADVPFLTQTASPLALAWGRGERMLSLAPLPARDCFLFCPEFPVSTAKAYGWLPTTRPDPVAAVLDAAQLSTWAGVRRFAQNDFEPVVAERYPVIASLLDAFRAPGAWRLLGEGGFAQLSGSGSAIFAIAGAPPPAEWTDVPQWRAEWRIDEPTVRTIRTTTADRVEPVILTD